MTTLIGPGFHCFSSNESVFYRMQTAFLRKNSKTKKDGEPQAVRTVFVWFLLPYPQKSCTGPTYNNYILCALRAAMLTLRFR